ncbi:DNA-binding GntR family transcriptional regulator [Mesorhizobium robiniae]|uniref:DNA-binding GntR family transcriptional regulator n=1 Tax=Mesorhizobium robiniae TaxID=559315 RepID=A0ABV2GIQ6_9HYPH
MAELSEIQTTSLSSQIYLRLRQQLMSARFHPGDRLKIRDLAQSLGTSETPVREALFQLVKDGALEMKPGYYIRVRRVNLKEYLEIRDIRLLLEPYAAQQALPHIDNSFIEQLSATHDRLVEAERTKDYPAALQANYDFHFSVYHKSQMPHLIEMLERLWIQIGPLLTFLYPHGHPTYDGQHQHLNVLSALKARDKKALRKAFEQDLIEGGRKFVDYLTEIEGKDFSDREETPRPTRRKRA